MELLEPRPRFASRGSGVRIPSRPPTSSLIAKHLRDSSLLQSLNFGPKSRCATVLRSVQESNVFMALGLRLSEKWGFRTMPISVPGHADHPFRDDGDHDSGMMPITRSGI